jgi:lipooligosaccharide transport system permease protein
MRRALHVFEHRLMDYRRTWRGTVFSSFLSPALFLAAMGIGLGRYVDQSGGLEGTGIPAGVAYAAFLAPGLIAANAMQSAAGEGTYPVAAAIMWIRQYPAMLATPITVRDIVVGQIAWWAVRFTTVAAIFVLVAAVMGAAHSAAIVLAVPAAILTGLAFVTPIAAFTARLKRTEYFNLLFRFVITPLFLFSGTFFPVDQLPSFLQPIAVLTPLYHGVALSRGLALETIGPLEILVHGGYLLALAFAGAVLFDRLLQRRLVP